jgi:hypothetical protein
MVTLPCPAALEGNWKERVHGSQPTNVAELEEYSNLSEIERCSP